MFTVFADHWRALTVEEGGDCLDATPLQPLQRIESVGNQRYLRLDCTNSSKENAPVIRVVSASAPSPDVVFSGMKSKRMAMKRSRVLHLTFCYFPCVRLMPKYHWSLQSTQFEPMVVLLQIDTHFYS